MTDEPSEGHEAVVLDYLPHGRTEDDRPQYQKQPLVYALDVDDFRLYEVVVDDPEFTIGDRVSLDETAGV